MILGSILIQKQVVKIILPVDKKDKEKYIKNILSHKKFNYEFESKPQASQIYDLMGKGL